MTTAGPNCVATTSALVMIVPPLSRRPSLYMITPEGGLLSGDIYILLMHPSQSVCVWGGKSHQMVTYYRPYCTALDVMANGPVAPSAHSHNINTPHSPHHCWWVKQKLKNFVYMYGAWGGGESYPRSQNQKHLVLGGMKCFHIKSFLNEIFLFIAGINYRSQCGCLGLVNNRKLNQSTTVGWAFS